MHTVPILLLSSLFGAAGFQVGNGSKKLAASTTHFFSCCGVNQVLTKTMIYYTVV